MKILKWTVFCFAALFFITPKNLYAQFTFTSTPAGAVIQEIQDETSYRFLYREALIADVRLSFSADHERLLFELEQALNDNGLQMQFDESRGQVIILRTPDRPPQAGRSVTATGQVVDARTGERLPFAAVTWLQDGELKGQTTGNSGTFRIQITTAEPAIDITARYIGYRDEQITLNVSGAGSIDDLTMRMEPESIRGTEIVVTENRASAPQDTSLTGVIR